MKILIISKICLIFCLLLAGWSVFAQEILLDKVVAVIEENVILLSELNLYTQMALQERQKLRTLDFDLEDKTELEKFRREILNLMIKEEIMLAEAKEESLEIDEERMNSQVKKEIDNMIARAGSKGELEKYLLKEGMTFKQLRKKFKKQLTNQYLKQMLQEKIKAKISLTKAETEKFYEIYQDSLPKQPESVKLSHIMLKIKPSKAREQEAKEKIEEILSKTKEGDDFAELAEKYSEGPSAKYGGDLGFFGKGQMVPEFDNTVFALNVGEVSNIVRTSYGYHIIKLEERKEKQVRARHILIKVSPSEEDEKNIKKRLEIIRHEILDGLDFAEAAQKYSDDEKTRNKEGSLGWLAIEHLIAEYKTCIDTLEINGLGLPIKLGEAWHLIKLIQKEKGRTLNLKDDWELISNAATNEEIRRKLSKKLDAWRKKFYVDIRL